jgi:hypothetical protein
MEKGFIECIFGLINHRRDHQRGSLIEFKASTRFNIIYKNTRVVHQSSPGHCYDFGRAYIANCLPLLSCAGGNRNFWVLKLL